MNRLFIALVVVPICHAMDKAPMIEFKCSQELATAVATQQVTQGLTMQQFMRNALLVTGTLKNPLGTAACYGGGKALQAAHPLMQKYVGTALQGKLHELKAIAEQLRTKISESWLPCNKEQAQLAALEQVINSEVAQELQVMRFGTYEQVQCSLSRIADSIQLHRMANTKDLPKFDKEVIQACRDVLSQNIHKVDVRLLDMTLTSPNSFQGPAYISQQAMDKIGKLDMQALGLEEYLKQSTQIINECGSLTLKQKQSLFVRAVQYFCQETLVGRLATTFTKQSAENLKANEFFKICKEICDWTFGGLYLSDTELMKYMEAAQKMQSFYKDLKGLDETRMHEVMKSLSDLLCGFAPGKDLKAAKKIGGRSAAVLKAYGEIK